MCEVAYFCCSWLAWRKSETELTASILKKDPKKHKRWKECFWIWRNRTECAHFWGSPLFQATHNTETEKQLINSTYLVSVRCGRLEEGKGVRVNSVPFSFRQPPTSKLTQDKLNCLFSFFYVVHSLKRRTSSKMCIFCPVFFNLKAFF